MPDEGVGKAIVIRFVWYSFSQANHGNDATDMPLWSSWKPQELSRLPAVVVGTTDDDE
jgi:hypothetical protein